MDEDERERVRVREGEGLAAWTAVEAGREAANEEKASLALCLRHVRAQTCSAPACSALSGAARGARCRSTEAESEAEAFDWPASR